MQTIVTESGPVAVRALLGTASSRRDGAERWNVVSIYGSTDGRYIVSDVGETAVPHEVQRGRTLVAPTAAEAVTALLRGRKRLSAVAQAAIDAACLADPAFEAGVRRSSFGIVEVLGFPEEPRPRSSVITLPRRHGTALRFAGRLIALRSSRVPGRDVWSEVAIFAADVGGFVTDSHMAHADGENFVAVIDDRTRVTIAPTAIDVMNALLVNRGLTAAAWDALRMAAERDEGFASEIGDRHLRAFARVGLIEVANTRSGFRNRHFAGIPIGSAPSQANGTVDRVFRVNHPRHGVGYLLARSRVDASANPLKASVCSDASPQKLVNMLSSDAESLSLLALCASRDRELARVARAGRGADVNLPDESNALAGYDPLDATLPRERPLDYPPPWNSGG